jgi:hypothetical protein
MANNDAQLGPSITNAVRFLRKIHKQISELFAALDGLMAERGWYPTEAGRMSWALSNGSDHTRWVLDYLFRWYYRGGSLEGVEGLVAFVMFLDPPARLDQPLMLGVVARFPGPTSYNSILDQWADTERLFEALDERPGPRLLLADEFSKFLPMASHVVGNAGPLCSLGGTEALLTQFIEPLLEALPTLGR